MKLSKKQPLLFLHVFFHQIGQTKTNGTYGNMVSTKATTVSFIFEKTSERAKREKGSSNEPAENTDDVLTANSSSEGLKHVPHTFSRERTSFATMGFCDTESTLSFVETNQLAAKALRSVSTSVETVEPN